MRRDKSGVFKLEYRGVVYYRLGNDIEDARARLGREKAADIEDIKILDGGKKQ